MASCVAALVVLKLLLVTSLTLSTTVTVRIDADNGTNTSGCITGNHSCRTLQYAVTNSYNDDTTFLLLSDLTLLSTVNFTSRHNITITGAAGQHKQLVCNCSYRTPCGLLFENITNLILENIAVKHCGISTNLTKNISIISGVIIKYGTNLSLNQFIASENNGYGTAILDTGGNVTVYNSSFRYNRLFSSNSIGGGGLTIVVSCSHTESTSGNVYSIINSAFYNNTIEQKTRSFLFSKQVYGGGVNVAFGVNTTNNKLLISNNNISNNQAVSGGGGLFVSIDSSNHLISIQDTGFYGNLGQIGTGMFLSCEDGCINNTVSIGNSIFKGNVASKHRIVIGKGGGLYLFISTFRNGLLDKNNFTLYNCSFGSNEATLGGGTYINCGQQFEQRVKNQVHFNNCSWKENHAPISPAVDVSPSFSFLNQSQYIANIQFTDCNFFKNMVDQYKYHRFESSMHMKQSTGAFLTMQVPVHFAGNISFVNNSGTALFALSSVITFLEGSNIHFLHNTGMFGGAMTFMGFSLLQYKDNTTFYFARNSATVGGAINVRTFDQHLSFASYNCFLYFWKQLTEPSIRPKNVYFYFDQNIATTGVGSAIYITTMRGCKTVCGDILEHPDFQMNPLFQANCFGHFDFVNYDNFSIATEGSIIIRHKFAKLTFTPGMAYQLPLDVLDDFHNNVTSVTVYAAQLANCSSHDVSIDPAFTNVASNTIRILGIPNTTCDLVLTIRGPHMIQVSVQFNLTWCRPGYVLDYPPGKQYMSSCVCSASLPHHHYNGIDYCNSTTSAAIINPGIWVGYISKELTQENLYTAACPAAYCNSTLSELNMPAELLKEYMCENNRQGFLCGECKTNTSVSFNSYHPKCWQNHNCALGPLFYIVYELLPISIVFIVIILADISLTSGVAYSAIFLAQILSTTSFSVADAVYFKPFKYLDYIYGIADLRFGLSFCFWSGATALQIKAMKYVSLLYAMGLIIVTITVVNRCKCAKLSRCLCCRTRQTSIVQGIVAFLVICYSQCARNSFKILTVATAESIGDNNTKYVVYYAGNIDYFHPQHLPYAIPAVFMLIVVVIPLPLVLFFDPFLLKIEGFLVQHRLLRSCLPWTQFRMKFKPFLDSFQGCFRDDARYFAGLFFVYRVAIYVSIMTAKNTVQFNIYLEAILIIMLTIQATVQPFENKFSNILSCFMFAVLLLMNTLTICVYTLLLTKGNSKNLQILVIQYLQTILCCIPIMVGLGVCGRWLVKKVNNCKYNATSTSNAAHDESLLLDRNNSYSAMEDRAGAAFR